MNYYLRNFATCQLHPISVFVGRNSNLQLACSSLTSV